MKKANTLGGLYFLVHFLVEITSFYVVTSYTQSPYVWILMFVYDFVAFVPQGVFGYLRDNGGLEQLPAGLRQAAELRLKMPDATLRELGEALDPPIGRSGVNHRLQRLSELAARLRGEEHPL